MMGFLERLTNILVAGGLFWAKRWLERPELQVDPVRAEVEPGKSAWFELRVSNLSSLKTSVWCTSAELLQNDKWRGLPDIELSAWPPAPPKRSTPHRNPTSVRAVPSAVIVPQFHTIWWRRCDHIEIGAGMTVLIRLWSERPGNVDFSADLNTRTEARITLKDGFDESHIFEIRVSVRERNT